MTGTQCSGPTGPLALKRRSRSSASFSASGLTRTIALSAGPFLSYASMRRRYCSTSERQVSEPSRNAASICEMVVSSSVKGRAGELWLRAPRPADASTTAVSTAPAILVIVLHFVAGPHPRDLCLRRLWRLGVPPPAFRFHSEPSGPSHDRRLRRPLAARRSPTGFPLSQRTVGAMSRPVPSPPLAARRSPTGFPLSQRTVGAMSRPVPSPPLAARRSPTGFPLSRRTVGAISRPVPSPPLAARRSRYPVIPLPHFPISPLPTSPFTTGCSRVSSAGSCRACCRDSSSRRSASCASRAGG